MPRNSAAASQAACGRIMLIIYTPGVDWDDCVQQCSERSAGPSGLPYALRVDPVLVGCLKVCSMPFLKFSGRPSSPLLTSPCGSPKDLLR